MLRRIDVLPKEDDELGPQVDLARLKQRLQEVGVNQNDFAFLIGIAPQTFMDVLNGRKPASLRMRYRIALGARTFNVEDGTVTSGSDVLADYTFTSLRIAARK